MTLSLLSFVETARIPLNAFLGPALDVYTNAESTETWLSNHLLAKREQDISYGDPLKERTEWWTQGDTQSEFGLLVKVDGDLKVHGYCRRVTELLLYACLLLVSEQSQDVLLTPPRSSSPSAELEDLSSAGRRGRCTTKLCARLISSDLCKQASQYAVESRQSSEDSAIDLPRFLTPPPEELPTEHHLVQKRQRLESLFDDAARLNKKSRRRGGETVAQIMVSGNDTSTSLQNIRHAQSLVDVDGAKASSILPRPRLGKAKGLSRSQSLGSLHDLDDVRPRSRHGNTIAPKRSSLNRVATVATFESSSPVPEVLGSLEQQNKNALTRVVMAGMRMYGFQPKRRPTLSRVTTENSPQPFSSDIVPGDEDEYKIMYHQTLKATSFTFRNYMSKEIISQDNMRDAVDRQLAIFCSDPMESDQKNERSTLGFGAEKSTEGHI